MLNPNILIFSTAQLDRRLGFFQTYFSLTGDQVRALAVRGPKVITNPLARIKDVTFTVKDEMGFEPEEVTQLLLEHPAIWKTGIQITRYTIIICKDTSF
jgi:mTERF domain-containing protein